MEEEELVVVEGERRRRRMFLNLAFINFLYNIYGSIPFKREHAEYICCNCASVSFRIV